MDSNVLGRQHRPRQSLPSSYLLTCLALPTASHSCWPVDESPASFSPVPNFWSKEVFRLAVVRQNPPPPPCTRAWPTRILHILGHTAVSHHLRCIGDLPISLTSVRSLLLLLKFPSKKEHERQSAELFIIRHRRPEPCKCFWVWGCSTSLVVVKANILTPILDESSGIYAEESVLASTIVTSLANSTISSDTRATPKD